MIIINIELMAEFGRARKCEWCKKTGPCEAHHIYARGVGGGQRLDVFFNFASLCRLCHNEYHSGNIDRADLLAIVAVREKCLQDHITDAVHFLRRLPKDWSKERIEMAMDEIEGRTRELVRRSLG